MRIEFITPMPVISPLSGLGEQDKIKGSEGVGIFKDMFGGMVEDARNAESNLTEKQYLLATGQIDDAHTVPAAASQAQLSIDMLVQMRNKAVEAYTEIMRTSL